MKMTFYLDLDHSGVRLRQGDGADELIVGQIALDDPQFETKLEDLRQEAEAMAGGPISTRLTIPQSEILFTAIEAEDEDETARIAKIETKLEDLTPYTLEDLSYDWRAISKKEVAVAAVARETLDQAEDFAVAHGFNPVDFLAEPRKGLFPRPPTFGQTQHALNGSAEETAPVAAPVTRIADLDDDETPTDTSEPVPVFDTPAEQEAPVEPAPDHAWDMGPDPVDDGAPDEPPVFEDDTPQEAPEPEDALVTPVPEPAPKTEPPEIRPAEPERDPSIDDPIPPMPAFHSRRIASQGAGATGPGSKRLDEISTRISTLPNGGAGAATPKPAVRPDEPAMAPAPRPVMPKPVPPPVAAKGPPGPRSGPTPTVRRVSPPEGGAAASLDPRDDGPPLPHTLTIDRPRDEAEKMTVFGARSPGTSRGTDSALFPILIGVLLALALAVGVWTAFALLSGPDELRPSDVQAALRGPISADLGPADPDPADAILAAPAPDATPDREIAALPQDTAPVTGDLPEPSAGDTLAATDESPISTLPSPEDPLQRPRDAGEDSRYAATGIAALPPVTPDAPVADRVEDVYTALPDVDLRAQDGVAALPVPGEETAAVPAGLSPPPPPGRQFDLNEDGRVVATSQGALTPQGVVVTAGTPPLRPPATPDRPEGEAPAPTAVSDADIVVPVNEGTPTMRPRSRPDRDSAPREEAGTASVEDTAPTETETEIDVVVSRLATLLPRPRPETISAPAATPDAAAERPSVRAAIQPLARPGDLAPVEAVAPAPVPTVAQASAGGASGASAAAAALRGLVPALTAPVLSTDPSAVARSLQPKDRPRNFDRTVARAAPQPARVAAATAVVRPSAPTTGTVASRATIANAIPMGRVNLMGVYGTAANRRALIRLPSGRFVKVQVGDRVDGGRINAIGNDRLSYVKGGRSVLLTMPRG